MAVTVLEYLYRETSNYTSHAEHVFAGAITQEQQDRIRALLR